MSGRLLTAVAGMAGVASAMLVVPGLASGVVSGRNGLIAFDSDRGGVSGNADVYVMRPDGSRVRRLTTASGSEPIWSPAGGRIAFVSYRDGNGEIYSMRADGSAQTRLTDMPGNDANPTWSPQGTRIAFQTNFPASQIYAMQANGSNPHALTTGVPVNFQPDWAANGQRIVFSSLRSGSLSIYVMNADGTNQTRLTNAGTTVVDQDPVWSPNSRRIAFSRNNEIYVMNADGSDPRNLTRNPATDGEPCWAPDGTRIGFASDRGGSTDIYTMRVDGSDVKRLTSEGGTDTHCEWQPVPLAELPTPPGHKLRCDRDQDRSRTGKCIKHDNDDDD